MTAQCMHGSDPGRFPVMSPTFVPDRQIDAENYGLGPPWDQTTENLSREFTRTTADQSSTRESAINELAGKLDPEPIVPPF